MEDGQMPQILVVTDSLTEAAGDVVYRERISSTDLESAHFSDQLVERVGWAVRDANELERKIVRPSPSRALALSRPLPKRFSAAG
jgi:hypothetical protein